MVLRSNSHNKKTSVAFTVIAVLFILIASLSGFASNASANSPLCTSIEHNCQFKPATEVKTPTIVEKNWTKYSTKEIQSLIKKETKRTKRVPVFYMAEKGLPKKDQKRCAVPTMRGWIKGGQKFSNTYANGVRFWGSWKSGDVLCNWRTGKDQYGTYIEGTIKRCGNRKIRIYLSQKRIRKQRITKVTEYTSVKQFIKKVVKTNETGGSKETTIVTTYVCDDASWTLIGNQCKKCPPPTTDCQPASAARCEYLVANVSTTNSLTFNARWEVSTTNATYTGAQINWGDGNIDSVNGQQYSHTYVRAGTYTISVTVSFTTPSGPASSSCSAVIVTPKDGTPGPGTGTPGTPGGPGSGGTPGNPTVGGKCTNTSGDLVDGTPDQHGYCI